MCLGENTGFSGKNGSVFRDHSWKTLGDHIWCQDCIWISHIKISDLPYLIFILFSIISL